MVDRAEISRLIAEIVPADPVILIQLFDLTLLSCTVVSTHSRHAEGSRLRERGDRDIFGSVDVDVEIQ